MHKVKDGIGFGNSLNIHGIYKSPILLRCSLLEMNMQLYQIKTLYFSKRTHGESFSQLPIAVTYNFWRKKYYLNLILICDLYSLMYVQEYAFLFFCSSNYIPSFIISLITKDAIFSKMSPKYSVITG